MDHLAHGDHNGITPLSSHEHSAKRLLDNAAVPPPPPERRSESFIMTGDKIIQKSSHIMRARPTSSPDYVPSAEEVVLRPSRPVIINEVRRRSLNSPNRKRSQRPQSDDKKKRRSFTSGVDGFRKSSDNVRDPIKPSSVDIGQSSSASVKPFLDNAQNVGNNDCNLTKDITCNENKDEPPMENISNSDLSLSEKDNANTSFATVNALNNLQPAECDSNDTINSQLLQQQHLTTDLTTDKHHELLPNTSFVALSQPKYFEKKQDLVGSADNSEDKVINKALSTYFPELDANINSVSPQPSLIPEMSIDEELPNYPEVQDMFPTGSLLMNVDELPLPPTDFILPSDQSDSSSAKRVIDRRSWLSSSKRYSELYRSLEIPPDDISLEDEKFNGITVDLESLPPPPDEFLELYRGVPKTLYLESSKLCSAKNQNNADMDSISIAIIPNSSEDSNEKLVTDLLENKTTNNLHLEHYNYAVATVDIENNCSAQSDINSHSLTVETTENVAAQSEESHCSITIDKINESDYSSYELNSKLTSNPLSDNLSCDKDKSDDIVILNTVKPPSADKHFDNGQFGYDSGKEDINPSSCEIKEISKFEDLSDDSKTIEVSSENRDMIADQPQNDDEHNNNTFVIADVEVNKKVRKNSKKKKGSKMKKSKSAENILLEIDVKPAVILPTSPIEPESSVTLNNCPPTLQTTIGANLPFIKPLALDLPANEENCISSNEVPPTAKHRHSSKSNSISEPNSKIPEKEESTVNRLSDPRRPSPAVKSHGSSSTNATQNNNNVNNNQQNSQEKAGSSRQDRISNSTEKTSKRSEKKVAQMQQHIADPRSAVVQHAYSVQHVPNVIETESTLKHIAAKSHKSRDLNNFSTSDLPTSDTFPQNQITVLMPAKNMPESKRRSSVGSGTKQNNNKNITIRSSLGDDENSTKDVATDRKSKLRPAISQPTLSPHKQRNVTESSPTKRLSRSDARTMAQKLFKLEDFTRAEVSAYLSKTDPFVQLVGEEFIKLYSFAGNPIETALRDFLSTLPLVGETQERERVLVHFSRRYLDCNPNSFKSMDACHTITCALLLLNTDLHGQNIGKKMTVDKFIRNLEGLNDSKNFDRSDLQRMYRSIKTEPLPLSRDENTKPSSGETKQAGPQFNVAALNSNFNPLLDIPDPEKAVQYKSGYIRRKSCLGSNGERTPKGKRSWKLFYARLHDMMLYLLKDDSEMTSSSALANAANAIRLHHALAMAADDYVKKQCVFRLFTSDGAMYLIQASNDRESADWINAINYVAAALSAPPLPSGVGSQRRFQRPLMPSSKTKNNLCEQLYHHEQRVKQTTTDLGLHRAQLPTSSSKAALNEHKEKEFYLQFELQRFQVYCEVLRKQLAMSAVQQTASKPAVATDTSPNKSIAKPSDNAEHNSLTDSLNAAVRRSLSDRSRALINGDRSSAKLYERTVTSFGTPV